MTIILCLAAVAGAVSLYARGSQFLGWDATWSKILVSGTAGAILAWASLQNPQTTWWAAVLVGCATSAGHAGWTGAILGRWGNHDSVFGLLRGEGGALPWVAGAVSGAQITLPMAVVIAGAEIGLFGVVGNPTSEQYQTLTSGAGVVIAGAQLVTGAYTFEPARILCGFAVLLAGMLRPLDYWLAPKIRPTGNPVPVAEAMYSARCWVVMLVAALVLKA